MLKKKICSIAAIVATSVAFMALSAPASATADLVSHVKEARGLIKDFAGALGKELKGGMKSGGPVAAIDVCNGKAPEIADMKSKASGWSIGRSSHKLRNMSNSPDTWEAGVINTFLDRVKAGEATKSLEHAEIVEEGGKKMFRYVKAIPTGKVCLACHGANVKPAIEARLKELYPDDQARGFKMGDLRGVFTLSKPL